MTRTATWTLSDTTIAAIASGLTAGGQVTAATAQPASVETITVSIPGESTDIQATTNLQLQ